MGICASPVASTLLAAFRCGPRTFFESDDALLPSIWPGSAESFLCESRAGSILGSSRRVLSATCRSGRSTCLQPQGSFWCVNKNRIGFFLMMSSIAAWMRTRQFSCQTSKPSSRRSGSSSRTSSVQSEQSFISSPSGGLRIRCF